MEVEVEVVVQMELWMELRRYGQNAVQQPRGH